MNVEKTILEGLIYNEDYCRKVLPFLKREYFQDSADRLVFEQIDQHILKYNALPTRKSLYIDIDAKELDEELFKSCKTLLSKLEKPTDVTEQWLLDTTEQFCKDRAIYNGIMTSIEIMDGKNKQYDSGAIPTLLQDALAVSFDTDIGHDFLEDAEERFSYYHEEEERLPFHIAILNDATCGGVPKKTLNIFLAGTNVGKTLTMCDLAANNLLNGKNVLYITMEDGEKKIAQRIEANLTDIPISEIKNLSKDMYLNRIAKLKKKTVGRLKIKEYPPAAISVAHIRHLLHEYKLKQNFVPDVIYVDYLNCMVSERLKYGSNVNSYTYVKSIAEELRGVAVIHNVPIFSATQTNRTGFTSSDPGLDSTAESFGLPMVADWMVVLVQTEELEQLNQYLVIQLKSRYNDKRSHKRFVIGVDTNKMRLYDCDQSAQTDLINSDKSVMDNTNFGGATKKSQKFDKSKFFELMGEE